MPFKDPQSEFEAMQLSAEHKKAENMNEKSDIKYKLNNFLEEPHEDVKGKEHNYDVKLKDDEIIVSLGDKSMFFKSHNWRVDKTSHLHSNYCQELQTDMQYVAQKVVTEYYNRIIKPAEETEEKEIERTNINLEDV